MGTVSGPASEAGAEGGRQQQQPAPPPADAAPAGAALHHLLAVYWSDEDAARVRNVAAELAADPSSGLALHLASTPTPPPPPPPPQPQPPAGSPPHPRPSADPSPGPASAPPTTAAAGASIDPAPTQSPSLDVAAVSARLRSRGVRALGRVLLGSGLLGSTQDVLRTHGSALGDGAVVVADRQTGGRGRGGNQWVSPPGCLMFSALRRLRVASPAQAPFINYLVCLAVTRGVAAALQDCGLPPAPLRIKWPNDIYAGGLKLGGALINTTWQRDSFNVITGIGLNVNNRTPTTCLDELVERALAGAPAAAVAAPGPAPVSVPREAVLAGILAAMEEVFDTFEAHGFAPLEHEYLESWLHSGQELDFDDSDPSGAAVSNGPTGRRLTRLTIRGLSPSGFLLAEDSGGGRYELTPDGNSLDMMAGLIRRKIM